MDFKGFYDEIIFDVDRSILKSYTGKQGDTKSRGLYVTVTQKNAVIDDLTGLSMRLFYEKPDKTRGFIDGVVDGSKFRIDYTNQMYAVPGVVKAELRLMGSNEEIITAKTFKILVDSSIADGSIVSENERGILDRAFELAEDIIPRLELLDVELLEDVQTEMLGARHSNTKDETYENLGDRLDAAEQDLLDHKAEYTSNRQQDQLKIAKVEKELNDYKATMQQININQEPKQKAAGYRAISLPPNAAEGQVSGIKIEGLTATNLIKNGDFRNGLSGWEGVSMHQIKMDTSRYLTGFQSARFEQEVGTITDYRLRQDIEVPDGHKVYYRAYIFCESIENSVYMRFRMSDIGGYDNNVEIAKRTREDFLLNQWECLSMIREVTLGSGGIRFDLTVYSNENATITLNADGFFAIDLTATFGAGNEPTKEECDQIFANWFDGTKSTISAFRIRSVSEDETQESSAYVIATDADTGEILELRSLPNGTKDKIDTTQGKLIKRISDEYTIKVTDIGSLNRDLTNVDQVSVILPPDFVKSHGMGKFKSELREVDRNDRDNINSIGALSNFGDGTLRYIIEKGTTLEQAKQQLAGTTLIYQLAEPIEIPIQVSGTLTSYPNGTVYIEPFVADAGLYANKIEVLHQDLPIKEIEQLSKVDFMTGVEIPLDVSKVEIDENGLSFTHSELEAGDIVFFTYEYDREGTQGETEIEYYDSRYIVKDTQTDKFYKWNIVVTNGQPSIELVEV